MDPTKIDGDEIRIFEYPSCCYIEEKEIDLNSTFPDCIEIRSPKDALLLIDSLTRYVLSFPYYRDNEYKK